MKNLVIGQSGGPTAVINASLCGAVQAWKEAGQEGRVYGMLNGIEGFLADRVTDLTALTEEELKLLRLTPAAYLGSCRFKLPEDLTDAVYSAVFDNLREMNIGYFLYVGGNDSMDTVDKLSRFAARTDSDVRFIGIPKTIDNDLVLTDHTPGFGSAAKYVASTVREIVLDASVYQQRSVTIIEIMGRHAGWLTAASKLARKYEGDNPILIYLPEAPFELEAFYQDLEMQRDAGLQDGYRGVCHGRRLRSPRRPFRGNRKNGSLPADLRCPLQAFLLPGAGGTDLQPGKEISGRMDL